MLMPIELVMLAVAAITITVGIGRHKSSERMAM